MDPPDSILDSDEEINGPPPKRRRKQRTPVDQSNWIWSYRSSDSSELVWRPVPDDVVEKLSGLLLRDCPLGEPILLPISLVAGEMLHVPRAGFPSNIQWRLSANDLHYNGTAMLHSKKYRIYLDIRRELKLPPRVINEPEIDEARPSFRRMNAEFFEDC